MINQHVPVKVPWMSSPMLFLGGIVFALDVIVMIVEFPEINVYSSSI